MAMLIRFFIARALAVPAQQISFRGLRNGLLRRLGFQLVNRDDLHFLSPCLVPYVWLPDELVQEGFLG
jgi:hypothetical protein